jgi:hypothetical protein
LVGNGKSGNLPDAKLKASKGRRAIGQEGYPHILPSGANLNRPKETKMSTNRLFNLLIVAALVAVVALTIWQSIETTKVVSAASQQNSSSNTTCLSSTDRLSLTSIYNKEASAWFPRTNQGPTGVDGGLLELLSNYRSCSIGKEK